MKDCTNVEGDSMQMRQALGWAALDAGLYFEVRPLYPIQLLRCRLHFVKLPSVILIC